MTDLLVAGDPEPAGLLAYLGRLVGLDGRAAVRLQAGGDVLGVWAGPPLDVVSLRPVRLARMVEGRLDVTVSAQRLLESVQAAQAGAAAQADGPLAVALPASVPGPSWTGLLPPRGGWSVLATVPTGSVYDAVRVAVEGFQRRVDQLPEPDRTPAALQRVADELWSRPVVAGVPLRAAHAADLLGLLGRDGEVTAHAAGPWVRLGCPGGSVVARTDGGGGTGMGLDLGVWSLAATPRTS